MSITFFVDRPETQPLAVALVCCNDHLMGVAGELSEALTMIQYEEFCDECGHRTQMFVQPDENSDVNVSGTNFWRLATRLKLTEAQGTVTVDEFSYMVSNMDTSDEPGVSANYFKRIQRSLYWLLNDAGTDNICWS